MILNDEKRQTVFQRPKKVKKKQKTFYLPPALIASLRLYAATNELSQSEIVEKALAKFFYEEEQK